MYRWVAIGCLVGCSCTGSTGPAGPQGPAGSDGSAIASINGVTPPAGYLGRRLDVVISGDNTTFDATSTVDFGPGVTVSATRLASPTELVCTIAIAGDATVGTRDVKVTTGATVLTASTAFGVAPSLGIAFTGGPILQGDLVDVTVSNLTDEPLQLPDAMAAADALLLFGGPQMSGQRSYFGIVNASTPAGPTQFEVSDDLLAISYLSDGAAFTVGPRTPTTLTLPFTGTTVFDTRSKPFTMQTSTLGILSVTVSAAGSSVGNVALLTQGAQNVPVGLGSLADGSVAAVTRATATTTNLIVGDAPSTGSDAAHTYTLSVVETAVAAVTPESTSPHPPATPQPLTSPAIVDATAASESDAYAITVPSGSTLEVTVSGIDVPADIVVVNGSGGLVTSASAAPLPQTLHATNAGATATYKVSVFSSQIAHYTLSVRTY